MAAKPAPLKASAAPKAVSKSVPAKIASPSRVVNTTMKTVRDDAGTMKLAPKTTVVAKPSVGAPLKAGSAPKAAPKPVQTSNIPASIKPTDLTTKIQQNLNRPQMQPISSNTPIVHNYQTGLQAQAELARAQAASAAQKVAQQKLLAQREAEKAAQQQANLKAQAEAAAAYQAQQAALAPKPVVQPAPQPAPVIQPKPVVQPAPVLTQPMPTPVAPVAPPPVVTPPPGYSLNKPVTTPAPQPITPVAPTPVLIPPAQDYSQYKLPTGWGFKAPTATAPKP